MIDKFYVRRMNDENTCSDQIQIDGDILCVSNVSVSNVSVCYRFVTEDEYWIICVLDIWYGGVGLNLRG